MTLEVAGFWAFAVVLVGAALAVVLSKNLFHSVLWLALALTGTAGVFLLLNAEFLAAVQILLYAGGVVTVVVFAIVVTERLIGATLSQTNRHVVRGAVAPAIVLTLVISWIRRSPDVVKPVLMDGDLTRTIGVAVLTQYTLAFELLAVLLLVSLVGASYFARPEE
jgi:NADH-quinone oxidoreductase subunit J